MTIDDASRMIAGSSLLDEDLWGCAKACADSSARSWLRMLSAKPPMPIVEWAQSGAIDMSYDKTSSASGALRLYPYQIEPLRACGDPCTSEVTLMWAPRLGKSTIWKISLLKWIHDSGASALIVYPTEKMALRTNRDTVLPLLQTLPETVRDLSIRGNRTKDSFHLPSLSSVVYFQGGGAQVVSYTCNLTIADETDQIELPNSDGDEKNIDQLEAIRTRMRTFNRRLMIACSSPTLPRGPINSNFLKGSREVWHMRCLGCGELLPANRISYPKEDGTYAGLQWSKGENGDVVEDGIRYICPKCGHIHVFADADEMNANGEYVAANPQVRHRSFQVGALAVPQYWPWWEIAQRQEFADDPDRKKELYNNVLGMPYIHRAREGLRMESALREKCAASPSGLGDILSIVVAGVDQQKSGLGGEKYFVYAVRGWDEDGNSYALAQGVANSVQSLDELSRREFSGHGISLMLIDQGGFAYTDDLVPFVGNHRNAMFYKGEDDRTLKGAYFIPSQTSKRLFLCAAIRYQVKLLSLMYDPPRESGYRWGLPLDPPEDYMEQLQNVKPNTHMTKDGNGMAYANWCAVGDARRDYFDAEKMALAALDIACRYIQPDAFRKGNVPLFVRKEWLSSALRNR